MTDYFLDSVGGSGTSPFDTWAKAATSWSNLTASVTPGVGDRVIIGNNHVENVSSALTLSTGGCSLISSTVSGTSTITATKASTGKQFNWLSGNNDLTIQSSTGFSSIYGVNLEAGKTVSFDNCILTDCNVTSGKNNPSSVRISPFSTSDAVVFYNCDMLCASTNQNSSTVEVVSRGALRIHGGTLGVSRTTDSTGVFAFQVNDGVLIVDGCDLNGYDRDNLLSCDNTVANYISITNVRLNSATTDTYGGATTIGADASQIKVHPIILDNTNAGAGATEVVLRYLEDTYGKAETNTTIYLDSSDGTTSYSDKVTSSADCSEFFEFFRYEMAQGFADFSTNKTLTVNFAQDGTATNLKDSEIWMEVQYPTSGNSSYSYVDDKASDNQTTANQTTNAESWTGLGGTNTKQEMSVTTSSGKEGPYKVFIYVSKPSTTVYIDPKVNIT